MRERLNEKQMNVDRAKAEARAKRYEEAHGKPDPERYSPMIEVEGKSNTDRGVKRPAPEEPDKSGKSSFEGPSKKSNKAIRFDSEKQSAQESRSDARRGRPESSDSESETDGRR